MGVDMVVLLAATTLLFSGAVKGMVGVGFPVVAMSALTVFMDPVTAIGLVSIPVLATNAWQAFQANNHGAAINRFWPLIAALAVGSWVGGLAVAQADTNFLLGAIGAIAVMFVLFSVLSPEFHISPGMERVFGPITGLGAGIMGGLTTVHGPPVMMYLLSLNLKKDDFVGTVGLIWFCGSIPMILAYVYKGVLGPVELGWSLLALIPSFAGLYLGQRVRGKINQKLFKNLLIAVLFIMGVNLIRRSVF